MKTSSSDIINSLPSPASILYILQRGSSTAEPTTLHSFKPGLDRGVSFNAETGEKESAHQLWEGSSYERMQRSRGRTMDRSNSFVGPKTQLSEQSNTVKELEGVVAVVDPFSTGAHLAAAVRAAGLKCARVLSIWDSPVANLVQEGINVDYIATIQHNDQLSNQEEAINDVSHFPYFVISIL